MDRPQLSVDSVAKGSAHQCKSKPSILQAVEDMQELIVAYALVQYRLSITNKFVVLAWGGCVLFFGQHDPHQRKRRLEAYKRLSGFV